MFGKKDTIKEFEQMRQALKPAERYAVRADGDTSTSDSPVAHVPPIGTTDIVAHPITDGIGLGDVASVLSIGSSWQGTLKIDGSVRIDGHVTGEIDAKETIYVSETARMNAKVRAAYVVIAGAFEGEVNCSERLQIMPSGRVKAELTTKSLTVFEGAVIEGQVRMTASEAVVPNGAASQPVRYDTAARRTHEKPTAVDTLERPSVT